MSRTHRALRGQCRRRGNPLKPTEVSQMHSTTRAARRRGHLSRHERQRLGRARRVLAPLGRDFATGSR